MQFKHPEVLYVLFALIIPIIVHLFQLQRFKKVPFTNVAFLKVLKQESRKSSRLKKFLVLASRMLAFTALIFAFAQPYFSQNRTQKEQNTIVYLDNSLSMQAKGSDGELLKRSAQDIIENASALGNQITIVTNDNVYKNIDKKTLKNTLLNINYSASEQDISTTLLKLEQLKSNQTNTLNKNILISDFQEIKNLKNNDVTNVNSGVSLVQVLPNQQTNISIDSVAIQNKSTDKITLKVFLTNQKSEQKNVSVSLFNKGILIGKTNADFSTNPTANVNFSTPIQENFEGKIVINDEQLSFDNTLYFSITKPSQTKVLLIGEKSANIAKIYRTDEFKFKQVSVNQIDYNSIDKQQVIVLNELVVIPQALQGKLNNFVKNGGSLAIIPAKNSTIESYNAFFKTVGLGVLKASEAKKAQITNINYAHPILNDVFEKQVKNFQYPTVNQQYKTNLLGASSIMSFDNAQAFVSQTKKGNGNVYWFASPINAKASNFGNSPLIVPLFYNIASYSFQPKKLYYTIGNEVNINIQSKLKTDEVLKLVGEQEQFIPLQKSLQDNVVITTNEQPSFAGFYQVKKQDQTLETLAYNYNRSESNLSYTNLEEVLKNNDNIKSYTTIKQAFSDIKSQFEMQSYFKWFIALTILFLLIELLLLKFFKV